MSHLFLIGTGLMGSSFALAARRNGLFNFVTGYDVDAAAVRRALQAGIVDRSAVDVPDGVANADAVLIAVPPEQIVGSGVAVMSSLGARRLPVFDLGSVKVPVIAGLRQRLGALPEDFVPCHPMAGSDSQGPGGADAGLFEGRRVFLTPEQETRPGTVAQVAAWWKACGAVVQVTSAAAHDRAVALTSHLPHLLAFAFMAGMAGRPDEIYDFAGPGFRDFTRIAGADAALWRQILMDNRVAVGVELESLIERLTALSADLAAGRAEAIESMLAVGRGERGRFLDADS